MPTLHRLTIGLDGLQSKFDLDFLHFGSNAYWLGNYTRVGPGPNQTTFVPVTPQQQFGPGPSEGHGYFSQLLGKFVWFGWIGGTPPTENGVPPWDSVISVGRVVEYDPGLSTVGDFYGMVRFTPVPSLTALRRRLLFASTDAWGSHPPGVLPIPSAAGNCLDIEINVTFEGSVVPADFGSIGVSIFGDSCPPSTTASDGIVQRAQSAQGQHRSMHEPAGTPISNSNRNEENDFDPAAHGPNVVVTSSANGSAASWGPVTAGLDPSCNQVAFLSSGANYTVKVAAAGQWMDIGWCSSSVDPSGANWIGPAPKYLGFQGPNKAWLYRNNHGGDSGLFKLSTPPSNQSQGLPYGRVYALGDTVTARRLPPGDRLEFLVNNVSQGVIQLPLAMPTDVVGCVAVCGGGIIVTGDGKAPPPSPPPCTSGGTLVSISAGAAGSFGLNGVPLAPQGSARPRPSTLTLRVLVDRSVVEAFAQRGRATWARMVFPNSGQNETALLWTQGASTLRPVFSVRVWEMGTGYA